MQVFIAILRGINVSGQKKIIMKDLIKFLEEIGLKDVKTYIQSGNLIFLSDQNSEDLKHMIQEKIKKEYDFFVPVLILTSNAIDMIVKQNPFLKSNVDLKALYLIFLWKEPAKELVEIIKGLKKSDDEFVISGKVIYLYCPNGYGKTKLSNSFFEKKLNLTASGRNWNTTLKLKEAAEGLKDKIKT